MTMTRATERGITTQHPCAEATPRSPRRLSLRAALRLSFGLAPAGWQRVAMVGGILDGTVADEAEAEVSQASHHAPGFMGTHQVLPAVGRLQADAVIVAGPRISVRPVGVCP